MAGRASNGESTIYKGADGRWHGYVSVGFTLDGKLDRRHVSSKSRGVVVTKSSTSSASATPGRSARRPPPPSPGGSSTG